MLVDIEGIYIADPMDFDEFFYDEIEKMFPKYINFDDVVTSEFGGQLWDAIDYVLSNIPDKKFGMFMTAPYYEFSFYVVEISD